MRLSYPSGQRHSINRMTASRRPDKTWACQILFHPSATSALPLNRHAHALEFIRRRSCANWGPTRRMPGCFTQGHDRISLATMYLSWDCRAAPRTIAKARKRKRCVKGSMRSRPIQRPPRNRSWFRTSTPSECASRRMTSSQFEQKNRPRNRRRPNLFTKVVA